MPAFRLLSKCKGLRGTAFDVFGYTTERKTERRMITDYETVIEELLDGLSADNHALATEIAGLPLGIRGFGHVKELGRLTAKDREANLLAAFKGGDSGLNADAAE